MEKTSKILLVASTEIEVAELEKHMTDCKSLDTYVYSCKYKGHCIDILISGIGIPHTLYRLTKWLSFHKYDLIMNIGVCGSFQDEFEIGDVLSVVLDEFADLGVTEKDGTFKTLFEEELMKGDTKPFKNGKLYNENKIAIDTSLPKVTSITVNKSSGNKNQIKRRSDKFSPDVETMEGAAVAYVCLCDKLNFLQIRSVSNYVEERNKENWDIDTAVKSLTVAVLDIIKKLNTEEVN